MNTLILNDAKGKTFALRYDAQTHMLTQDGVPLQLNHEDLPPTKDLRWQCSERLSIRIALGKRCNFHCVYCHQEKWRDRIHRRLPEDADQNEMDQLVEALTRLAAERGGIGDIQFWGGEALVYFDEIRYLHRKLREVLGPDTDFFIATNGSLLYGERFQWVVDNDIKLSLSWDGDGQLLRGQDILQNPRTADNIKKLFSSDADKYALAPVISRLSGSLLDVTTQAKALLGVDTLRLTDSRLVVVSDDASESVALPESALPAYARDLHVALISGKLPEAYWAYAEALIFLRTLNRQHFPLGATRCFANSEKTLTVDTRGNILTCQNFSASSVDEDGEHHLLGNILQGFDKMSPDLHRLKARQQGRCANCPVQQICKGGCPYWPKKYEEYNCKANYYQAIPILGLAIHMLTGAVLTEIVQDE